MTDNQEPLIPLNEVQAALWDKLGRKSLSSEDIVEGIRQCFMCCHLQFALKRDPNASHESVNKFAAEIVNEVFDREGIRPETASPQMLKHVIRIIDEQFLFMGDAQIRADHKSILNILVHNFDQECSETFVYPDVSNSG